MDQSLCNRVRGSYKRSHSMDSWFRGREEDLALFQDMQAREQSNFLYPSTDDIELSIKFGELANNQSSFLIPIYQPGRDLLTADVDKHDYDWLLTPPGTPLFPSLDEDTLSMNLPHRSALTQSASFSRTSRLSHLQEPHPKMFRRSQSPCRPSTASSTSSTHSSIKGRSSSPLFSPNRRNSAPITRSSMAGRVSETVVRSARLPMATLCRTNTAPTIRLPSGKTRSKRRGTSLSPKLQAWYPASLSEFSSEPPPNLRISMSDWNSRHGSTCGTRNSCIELSQTPHKRRQPVSPNTSRSSSSFFSQDRCSSQTSKGSGNSSCDDDELEVSKPAVLSNKGAIVEWTFTGTKLAVQMDDLPGSKYNFNSKRQIKQSSPGELTPSVGAISRKASESRQMEYRHPSHSMFRPLLSSVPASSFYSTRVSAMQCGPLNSAVDSSITVGSNTSSKHGVCIFHDNESSDEPECKGNDWDKQCCEIQANRLAFNELDVMKSNWHHDHLDRYSNDDSIDHVRQDGGSNLDLEDPQNETIGNDTDIDMSITQSHDEVFIDRQCNYSSVNLQNENVNNEEQAGNWPYPGPSQDNLPSFCKENNTDHNFVDIEEDLSITTQKILLQDLHFDKQNTNSFHSLKSLEADVSQIYSISKMKFPIKQEVDYRQIMNVLPSKQDQEFMLCADCNLEPGFEEPCNLAEGHLKELCKHGELNCQYGNESRKDKDIECKSNISNSEAKAVSNSLSNLNYSTSVLSYLSCERTYIGISEPASSTDGITINQGTNEMVDSLAAIENSSANLDTMSSVNNGAYNFQRDPSNVGTIPVSFAPSLKWENSISIDKQSRISYSMPSCLSEEYDEGVKLKECMNSHDKPIRNISEGYFQENFTSSIDNVADSECGLSKATQSGRFTSDTSSELTVGPSNSASREKRFGSQMIDGWKSEASCGNPNVPNASSLSHASGQACDSMISTPIDGLISSVQEAFEIPNEDLWQTSSFRIPVSLDTKNKNDSSLVCIMDEQEDPAAVFSIEKVIVDEQTTMDLRDITHESSTSQKRGPNPFEDGTELAVCGRGDVMQLTAYVTDDVMQNNKTLQQLGKGSTTPDNVGEKPQPGTVFPSHVLNLEAARDSVTFCSSIIYDTIDRAVAMALEKEDQNSTSAPDSTREEPARLHGSFAAEYLSFCSESKKGQRSSINTGSTVCRTLTYVQKKQKMVLQHTPMVTHQQNPVEKTGTAVLKNEEMFTPSVMVSNQENCNVPKQENCKSKKVKCRCRCSIM